MAKYRFLTNVVSVENPTFDDVKLAGLWIGGNTSQRNWYFVKIPSVNIPIKLCYCKNANYNDFHIMIGARKSDINPLYNTDPNTKIFVQGATLDGSEGVSHYTAETFKINEQSVDLCVVRGPQVTITNYNDDIPLIEYTESSDTALALEIFNDGVWTGGNDPYDPGETSRGGVGGDGDYNINSDPISIPPLPSLSAVTSGMLTLFHPSLSDIRDLSDYLWSDAFDIETWKKVFGNPMDAILGLSIVPVAVPDVGSRPVVLGNIDTGLTFPGASSQYVEVDCGGVSIENFWGSYLDYAPYTKVDLYLPFCGVHPIDVDDVMGKNINVVYHVDVLSGACVAMVKCGDSVLYSFAGHCATQIPVTGANWSQMIHGALTVAGSIGTMVASGGMSAPLVTGIASTAVNSMKPSIEKSGSLGGSAGFLGVQKPYFIITRPRQCVPASQAHFIGYPSFVTSNLGDLTGYTEVDTIHLENIPATQGEINEIESLLKEGVIL